MPFLRGFRSRSHSDPALSLSSPRRGSASSSAIIISPLPAQPEHASSTSPRLHDSYIAPATPSSFHRTRSTPVARAPPEYAVTEDLPPSRFPVMPREEEGCEALPPYSSSLMRAAVLSRKLELLSPLEPAPNRSWQTVIVVLNNTQLNVYRAPATLHPVSAAASRVAKVLPWRSASFSGPSSSSTSDYNLMMSSSVPSHINHDDTIDPFSLLPTSSATSASSSSASLSPTPTSSVVGSTCARPSPAQLLGLNESAVSSAHLIRSYTLQYAQIGLGTDYKKKQNVIRVRAEGEQFLLLCNDARECIEWTSAMQVACDLALPLEERTIPRYRSIPSRRRRRILPSARHPSRKSAIRHAAPDEQDLTPVESQQPISAQTTASDGLDAAAPAPAVAADPPADAAGEFVPHERDAHAHDEDEDDEDELYYRRGSPTSGSEPQPRRQSTAMTTNGEDSGDEDQVPELPSRCDVTPVNSIPSTRSRRGSVPRSFTTYDEDDSFNEDPDAKWAPPLPFSSTSSKLRYAIRCLYTLPADGSWGDKLLMAKGDQFIIRERVLV
ncbi:hypothetical protein V1525DRAFT_448362 [Lipomyces kononenkoae]|uniref:Uncharacterized protein n=1 Tax=Lipomyces kononenkoae TaxID=34357 RepID=A0ACC3T966_LIPKO